MKGPWIFPTCNEVMEKQMKLKLFAVKTADEIYYVVAEDYSQASTLFMMSMSDRGKDRVDPEKIALSCDADHLIMQGKIQ